MILLGILALLMLFSPFDKPCSAEDAEALSGLDSGTSKLPGAMESERALPGDDIYRTGVILEALGKSFLDLAQLAALSSADWFRRMHSDFMVLVEAMKRRLEARIADLRRKIEPGKVVPPPLPRKVADRYEIALLYRKHLGRSPEKAEIDRCARLVKSGRMTLAGVRKAILSSPEYRSKHPGKPKDDGGGNSGKDMDRTGRFRVITQNVRALPLMNQELVRHDIELTAGQADIVGWQEIGPDYYKKILESLPREQWETFWGKGHAHDRQFDSPISWRRDLWKKIDGGAWELHPPHAKISVRRFYTWIVLEHRGTGARMLVTNKHYIAGAWNDEEKPFKELRPQMWREGIKKEVQWLENFMEKNPGMPIVLLGDYNANQSRDGREFPDRIGGRNLNFQVPPRSIDQIILIHGRGEGSWHWEVEDEDGQTLTGRHSDHQGRRSTQGLLKVK